MAPARRSVVRTFRVTEEEAARLDTIAQQRGLTLAEIIREAVLERPPRARRPDTLPLDLSALVKTLGETRAIGRNVNQIARALNAAAQPGENQSDAAYRRALGRTAAERLTGVLDRAGRNQEAIERLLGQIAADLARRTGGT